MGTAFRKPTKRAKAKNGEAPKPTPELTKQICEWIKGGNYIETACAISGINKQQLYSWLKQAHIDKKTGDSNSIYAHFLDAVEVAEATAEARDVLVIDQCANGKDWEYERHPEGTFNEYGKDISGQLILKANGNPIVKTIGIPPNWQAAAWRLSRKYKKWASSENSIFKSTDQDDSTIKIEFVKSEQK